MKKRGFTILELLVVIAIIVILVSVTLVLFGGPRAKSRDTRRESDMKEMHNALSLYANQNGIYPICITITTINGTSDCLSATLISAKSISVVPRDPSQSGTCIDDPINNPSTARAYCYKSSSDGTTFVIYYNREMSGDKPSGWNVITP